MSKSVIKNRGFCGIGIYHPHFDVNVGGLFRSAFCLGADFIFTIGRKYKKESSDTCNAALHVPYYHYLDKESFLANLPNGCRPTLIELSDKARDLNNFCHPERAVYILGNEGGGLPQDWLDKFLTVKINTRNCLNVATAGSIVLFHRNTQYEK